MLAEFEPVEPPPEISSDEAPAEVVRRLEALERRQPFSGDPPPPPRGDLQQRRDRAIDALNRLRNEKAAQAQAERNKEHERRCSRQSKQLEGRIAEAESKRDAEQERHRKTVAELDAAFSEAKLQAGRAPPLPSTNGINRAEARKTGVDMTPTKPRRRDLGTVPKKKRQGRQAKLTPSAQAYLEGELRWQAELRRRAKKPAPLVIKRARTAKLMSHKATQEEITASRGLRCSTAHTRYETGPTCAE